MSNRVNELESGFWASYNVSSQETKQDELISGHCSEWWASLPTELQSKWLSDPKTPTKNAAWKERCRRLEASSSALASVGLEGFSVPEADIANMQKFIEGEISFSEALETLYLKASA